MLLNGWILFGVVLKKNPSAQEKFAVVKDFSFFSFAPIFPCLKLMGQNQNKRESTGENEREEEEDNSRHRVKANAI